MRNAERLTNLINDILDVEKLGSGTLSMQTDAIDLGEVLRDACEQNRPFADQHGAILDLRIAGEPLRVVGDHGRLLQAVTNLISNACKFSPTGSTVTVAGAREDAFARISVADRGRGIAPEFRSRIFSRFAQADPSNKLSGAVGTGLGLAITKAIIERHQGEIGFTSEPGNGTLFWIRLPRILEEVS
jgi:signal transduction histidine kinase